jgi:hypothetical protein
MNDLNQELKRLMRWAKQAPPLPPAAMPLGFSQKVTRAWVESPAGDALGMWQWAISRSAWAGAVLILVALAIFMTQWLTAGSAYDFGPAYQVVSTDFIP